MAKLPIGQKVHILGDPEIKGTICGYSNYFRDDIEYTGYTVNLNDSFWANPTPNTKMFISIVVIHESNIVCM